MPTNHEDLIRAMLTPALLHPAKLVLASRADNAGVAYRFQVSGADMGRTVGRGGSNIEALKYLVELLADPGGFSVIALNDPNDGLAPERAPFHPEWRAAGVVDIARRYLAALGYTMDFRIVAGNVNTLHILNPIDPDIIVNLGRWLSNVATVQGGRLAVEGAHHANV